MKRPSRRGESLWQLQRLVKVNERRRQSEPELEPDAVDLDAVRRLVPFERRVGDGHAPGRLHLVEATALPLARKRLPLDAGQPRIVALRRDAEQKVDDPGLPGIKGQTLSGKWKCC